MELVVKWEKLTYFEILSEEFKPQEAILSL
jgi:hypothetical protein